MADDEAILAALDTEPDAFAEFYRRHVDALLAERSADVCAETFATALLQADRFDPERASSADWLGELADDARGDRARRRLGMAPLEPGPGFVDALEEELVAAARFRAVRAPRRFPLVGLGLVVLAAGAVLVALAITGGERERERATVVRTDRPLPASASFPIVPMRPLVSCPEPEQGGVPQIDGIGLLARDQVDGDRLAIEPDRLPIGSFDRDATRAVRTRSALIHVVPSASVAEDGRCGSADGPGVCLVVDEREFSCFPFEHVHSGAAVALTADGTAIGLVPDAVERVTLAASGPSTAAVPVDNVFELRSDAVSGEQVLLGILRDDHCRRGLAPELLQRTAILREDAGRPLPRAAVEGLGEWSWELDAIVEHGARYWGSDEDVDFWALPVVPVGGSTCTPATRVCVVAVPARSRARTHCVRGRNRDGVDWVLTGLSRSRAVLLGLVPNDITGARVTRGDRTTRVEANKGIVAGVLPFPFRVTTKARVALLRG